MSWASNFGRQWQFFSIPIFRLCRIFLFAVWSIVFRSHFCQELSNVGKWTAPNDLWEGFMASVGKDPNLTKELRTQPFLFRLLNKWPDFEEGMVPAFLCASFSSFFSDRTTGSRELSYILDRFINGNVHCKWSYSKEKGDKATVEVSTEGKRKKKIFLKRYDKIMPSLSIVNLHIFLLILSKCQVSANINQKYSSESVC